MGGKNKRHNGKSNLTLDAIALDFDIVLIDNSAAVGYITRSNIKSTSVQELSCVRRLATVMKAVSNIYMAPDIVREFMDTDVKDHCMRVGGREMERWRSRVDLNRHILTCGKVFKEFAEDDAYVHCLNGVVETDAYKKMNDNDRRFFKPGFWAARTGRKTLLVTNDRPIIACWRKGLSNGEFQKYGVNENNFATCMRRGIKSYEMMRI